MTEACLSAYAGRELSPDRPVRLPDRLSGVFFDWRWDTARVWALPTPTTYLSMAALRWQLQLTVWTTVKGEARFDLAPATVLAAPASHARHYAKIESADLSFALELFQNGGRWVILDGYHRLCGHQLRRSALVPVRLHPEACRPLVQPP